MEKRVLGGRYEIIEKIGEGGMAVVFKAKCHLLNRFVAVKVLKPEFTRDKKFIENFGKESQAAASLSHPNIVSVYDVGVEGKDIYYIVMELVDGQSLNEILETVGKVSYKNAVKIGKQVAAALANAHKNNVIHRDIKPHNIMITTDGRAKVTDFGIAKAVSNQTIVSNDVVMGSVHYTSPEQARGGYVDGKTDIYSLGILLYEIVTGKVPFESDSAVGVAMKHINDPITPPSEIQNNFPEDLEAVIMKATSKVQSDRFQNAKEMFDALDSVNFTIITNPIKTKSYNNKETVMMPAIKENKKIGFKKEKRDNQINEPKGLIKGIGVRAGAVILAILLAFMLSQAVIAVKGVLLVKEVAVPDLTEVDYKVATEKLNQLGLIGEIENRIYNSNIAEFGVISQNPLPNAIVKEGNVVKFVVSRGPKMVEVPILINKKIDDAREIIAMNNLEEGIISHEASALPTGRVIRQEPDAKTTVSEGTAINIVVSEGVKVETILMINVIGKPLSVAMEDIEEAGLVLGNIDHVDNDELESEIVISQSVEAGEEIEENSTVDLVVSQTPLDPNAPTEGTSTSAIEENPIKAVTLDLPFDEAKEDTFELNIYKIVDDKMSSLYYGIHKKTDSGNNIVIRGEGEVRIAIYFDTDLIAEKTVDFDTGEIDD